MPPKLDKTAGPVVLYWHRTDLRLHDSPALDAALSLKPSVFVPVWTWDPHYVYRARVGPNRWRFLLECQRDLSASYTKLNRKQKLWLVREAPQTVLPKLWKAWKVSHMVFEKDTDAYAGDRDEQVLKLAEEAGVTVIVKMGRTLFDPDALVRNNHGKPTMSMSQVQKAAEKINNGHPDKPLDPPETIPDPWDDETMDLSGLERDIPDATVDLNEAYRGGESEKETQYHDIMGPKKDFAVPTLEELGIDPKQATSRHHGGEANALKLLAKYIQDEDYIGTFEKPKTSPAAFDPQSTTLLSPHLHFGSLSVRKFWWDVQTVFEKRKKQKKPVAAPPANLPGQLLFRDMYFAAQAALGYSFAKARGNKVARFIDWHLQSLETDQTGNNNNNNGETEPSEETGSKTYVVDSPEAEEWLHRWKHGQTGFPWIDALMRQLKQEGWIHHLGRHSVACFLTRGGCYISWERGVEVFEEWLIDHETSCNVGNWHWLSCTAFFSQFYRCYSPISFGKKYDPDGLLIRKYVPELSNFDKRYIYEPWLASIADQKRWGCRIQHQHLHLQHGGSAASSSSSSQAAKQGDGESESEGIKTYPKPMFDFNQRRQICLDKMKNAYDVGLYGDDPKVLDGSWKELFGGDNDGKPPQKKRKV